ncbi:MAG: type III pantothenate kinase [Cyanobacteriota bacterium]|nr:type III pantothenate kinase [Cyanobacteriota bacterium]
MSPGGEARWLLVGNSRWHWAAEQQGQRRYWSEPPASTLGVQPQHWAAVGALPPGLDAARQIVLAQVPLQLMPPSLGIDRALAGYQAWSLTQGPVLVADAGTALSLTWIDARGCFAGGRLMAGAALQLRALHQATEALPAIELPAALPPADGPSGPQSWPRQTVAALQAGVLEGLAGALQRAAWQLQQREPRLQLWLTGGDGQVLAALLNAPPRDQAAGPWRWDPGLCLDGLARVAALS